MTGLPVAAAAAPRESRPGTVRLGFMGGADPGEPTEITRWAAHCERIGADLLAVGEGATLFPDSHAMLQLAAAATARLRIGAIVGVPGLRHPAVLANTLATLQRLSGGRMFLGLGTGDLGRLELGLRPASVDELGSYAGAVRALTAGEVVAVDGEPVRIRWATPADRVPVLLGADGPRTQDLAGRLADAVVVGQAAQPEMIDAALSRVRRGAEAAGRDADEIAVWFMCRAYVADRTNGAIHTDGLDEYGARQAHYFWRTAGRPDEDHVVAAVRDRKGVTLDEPTARRLVRYCGEFDSELAWRAGDKTMVGLLDRYELREWAGEMFYLSGPPAAIADRLRSLHAAGGRNFVIPMMLGDRYEASEQIARIFYENLGDQDEPEVSPSGQPT